MKRLSGLDELVRDLEQHENSTRLKKLMYCACQGQWENDVNLLAVLSFKDLTQKLIKIHPTISQLSASLYTIVQTLNRQEEYSLIAHSLIGRLTKFYQTNAESTQVVYTRVTPSLQSVSSGSIFSEAIQKLESNPNSLRIKKLIYSVCKNSWENDPAILARFPLHDLVKELCELNPSLDQLSFSLFSVVQTLNRQSEYTLVANTIVSELKQLYNPPHESTQIKPPQPLKPNPPLPAVTPEPTQESPSAPSPVVETKHTYDSFDVRLEVMKYTNPLRAKILIFSTLAHPFDYSGNDWSALREYKLDDLLLSLFFACETVQQVELKLYETIKYLDESDEITQTASAIVQAMKLFYS